MLSDEAQAQHPERLAQVETAAGHDPARRTELALHALAAGCHDAREALGGIAAPTLVLTGDRDELLGSGPCEELAKAIPGATLTRIENAGHDLTLEQPEATARVVAEFFSR
jgi:3-oxoadipate enol-lactonase